ncbi:MAG TPA: hypothetical protein VLB76_12315 [Thermoanaerobaculia bacterium]|jgi:hypothetical protein|nr:hypothetical protein [Thermoanaerobaculia bacterium]
MPIRTRGMFAALVLVALAAAPAVTAQTRPGVGYDPQARGLAVSHYQLDTLTSPFLSYQVDYSARPDLVGAHPNPYVLSRTDPAVVAAFERRWGPFTASTRLKKWAGPGNEVRFVLHDALVWAWTQHPELLGGDTANRNGEPTEVELTDMQALNDTGLWVTYFQTELPGFSPDHRVVICDPAKPPGDSQGIEPFWGIPYYTHNKFQPSFVSPQLPAALACPGS